VLRSLAAIVGESHVLTGDATAGFAVDWTGRFRGQTPAVVRPGDTAEVAAVLALCTDAGLPVVPQGGNTGLVGGGVPLRGEVVLSLTRLNRLGPVDQQASQITAGAGVTLQRVADADPELDLGIAIASRDSATVGGAVATNAGGVRVLRYGPMRAQLRGVEAVLADGTVVSHLGGLVKDNTGYDYPSLLAGSEGTLAVVTAARLRLVPRLRDTVTALVGLSGLDELHALTRQAVREVPGLVSAEFFTATGLDILVARAGLAPPLARPARTYLLLEAAGPGALEDLADVIGDREAAVAESAADRGRLWSYRERQPEAAGFLGVPIKLDVAAPAGQWVRLASQAADVVAAADPGAVVITFGHVADGNVHVNIVPAEAADGRHEEALLSFVASLGGSISAEHGIGALKAQWLPLARTDAERALFGRLRSAFDPSGTLNPNVLPRLSAVLLGVPALACLARRFRSFGAAPGRNPDARWCPLRDDRRREQGRDHGGRRRPAGCRAVPAVGGPAGRAGHAQRPGQRHVPARRRVVRAPADHRGLRRAGRQGASLAAGAGPAAAAADP
jgi:FAD/FMN-containing dehydrogenase